MSPITHLLASWIIAAKTTNNQRDCRLVSLAGVLPDLDGLGMAVDLAKNALHGTDNYYYYQEYHHWWTHGVFGAVLVSCALACFARQRGRVLLLCLLVFHLHLLCDLLGSRGPERGDLWPVYYLGPFSRHWVIYWKWQWRLDGWQNRVISVVLFLWALWMASGREDSVVGVFNRRLDRVVTGILRKWRAALFRTSTSKGQG